MSVGALDTNSANRNPIQQNGGQTAQQGRIRSVSLAAGASLCLAIITAIGIEVASSRPACKEWDSQVSTAEQEVKQAEGAATLAEKEYQSRAQLNCDRDWDQSVPFTPRNRESLEFCRDHSKDKISSFWSMDPELCETPQNQKRLLSKIPGMKLSCFSKEATKTQAHFAKMKGQLANRVGQKPLFCSRGRR